MCNRRCSRGRANRPEYADVAELLAGRGIRVDPSSIYDRVQAFTPLHREAARSWRHPARGRWALDETYIKAGSVAQYVFRALDERGHVMDVFVNPTRAAVAFLRGATAETEVRPHAAIYPPALAAVLAEATQVAGQPEQQGIGRDHQHLKSRYLPMHGFKQASTAQVACAGHGFMRNLRNGFYRLGLAAGDPHIPRAPRLMRAWDELTALLRAA